MAQVRRGWSVWLMAAGALLVAAGALTLVDDGKAAAEKSAGSAAAKTGHVPEVAAMLQNLTVDPVRKHQNMLVFPVRYGGKQVPGEWTTLDDAAAAGSLKVLEKDQASVPEVTMENAGAKTILVLSGEIIKGGKQTRLSRKDAILEPKQRVALAVFCVEQNRWAGSKEFTGSGFIAPASIQDSVKRGAEQGEVWHRVREVNKAVGAKSATDSLEEGLSSPAARQSGGAARGSLGKFSPPDTIGIAVADARTGRVVGLELFGTRALFERLQDKLIEGYALDLVPPGSVWNDADARKVTEKDVEAFIARVLGGTSRYEPTPGSGRGIDLVAGTMRGKGVAQGDSILHLSIQDVQPSVSPVRPIVNSPPTSQSPIRSLPRSD